MHATEIKFVTPLDRMTNVPILPVVGYFRASIVGLLLIVYFVDFVRAQDGSFSGKSCVIAALPEGRKYNPTYHYTPYPTNGNQVYYNPETLKGTCYYDKNGALSYWIVRWWNDQIGKPFPDEKEFVGYAVALEEQKRYNHEIVKGLGGANFGEPPYGRCKTNGYLDNPDTFGACWNLWPLKGPNQNSDLPYLRMNVPRGIPETGKLDADTLRIPLFAKGGALLRGLAVFRDLCIDVDTDYVAWKNIHAQSGSAQTGDGGDNDISFCDPKKDRPKNDKLNQYQTLLQAIGDQLNAAQAAARRFDEIITEYYTPDQPEIPPAGLANQLAWLQTSIEIRLRKSHEVDQRTETYEKTFPEFFAHPPIHQ
jgi:hypothetical protein